MISTFMLLSGFLLLFAQTCEKELVIICGERQHFRQAFTGTQCHSSWILNVQ